MQRVATLDNHVGNREFRNGEEQNVSWIKSTVPKIKIFMKIPCMN